MLSVRLSFNSDVWYQIWELSFCWLIFSTNLQLNHISFRVRNAWPTTWENTCSISVPMLASIGNVCKWQISQTWNITNIHLVQERSSSNAIQSKMWRKLPRKRFTWTLWLVSRWAVWGEFLDIHISTVSSLWRGRFCSHNLWLWWCISWLESLNSLKLKVRPTRTLYFFSSFKTKKFEFFVTFLLAAWLQ